jgi:alkylation response protein AidB-like acyl-CoA dehydrogenase
MFKDPWQWFGHLDMEMLRAARLVVDTGLHAQGWSREVWAQYAELGLLGLPFAEAEGGFGGGREEVLIVAEQMGRAITLEPWLTTVVVGGGAPRLWNTLALLPPPGPAAADGRKTVARLAAAGVEASTGAACSAGSAAAARVVAAIGAERLGVAPERLRGMVRLSGGWQTTAADWTAAVDALVTIARGAAAPLPGVTLARPE